jgi:hypothetical protein
MRVAIAVALCGCGRVGFDPINSMGDGGGDVGDVGSIGIDAAELLPCPLATTAPDPIVISGSTIQVTQTGPVPEPSVMISIRASVTGPVLASTTSSAANGSFSVSVPSAGMPTVTIIYLEKASLLSTLMTPDQPVDTNVPLGATAFVSSQAATTGLYNTGGVARDTARGTIVAHIRDCSGVGIAGATLSVTPAPAKIVYADASGVADAALTATTTQGGAWALNVGVGPVLITAQKAGTTFARHRIDIVAGDTFTFTPVRPLP